MNIGAFEEWSLLKAYVKSRDRIFKSPFNFFMFVYSIDCQYVKCYIIFSNANCGFAHFLLLPTISMWRTIGIHWGYFGMRGTSTNRIKSLSYRTEIYTTKGQNTTTTPCVMQMKATAGNRQRMRRTGSGINNTCCKIMSS